jgi:hypothetical protein
MFESSGLNYMLSIIRALFSKLQLSATTSPTYNKGNADHNASHSTNETSLSSDLCNLNTAEGLDSSSVSALSLGNLANSHQALAHSGLAAITKMEINKG